MADTGRYAKTEKGATEISKRQKNLHGRMRTMLILVDPSKTTDELRAQAAQLGVPPDFLDTLVRDGYIAPVGTVPVQPSGGTAPAESHAVSVDELSRFRAAKAFMNDTAVDALGIRAFAFTMRLERCSTLSELGGIVPDYVRMLRKKLGETEVGLLVERLRELLP